MTIIHFNETSHILYNQQVLKKSQRPKSESKWLDRFHPRSINFNDIYDTKVQKLVDKKVAEFNFKLLHNILPCNSKLHSWGFYSSTACVFCNQLETVDHILFECKDVVSVWYKLLPVCNMSDINVFEMIFGGKDATTNWLLSLIQQKIFKRWVLYHNQKTTSVLEHFLHQELQYKLNLYEQNGYLSICQALKSVLSILI